MNWCVFQVFAIVYPGTRGKTSKGSLNTVKILIYFTYNLQQSRQIIYEDTLHLLIYTEVKLEIARIKSKLAFHNMSALASAKYIDITMTPTQKAPVLSKADLRQSRQYGWGAVRHVREKHEERCKIAMHSCTRPSPIVVAGGRHMQQDDPVLFVFHYDTQQPFIHSFIISNYARLAPVVIVVVLLLLSRTARWHWCLAL